MLVEQMEVIVFSEHSMGNLEKSFKEKIFYLILENLTKENIFELKVTNYLSI